MSRNKLIMQESINSKNKKGLNHKQSRFFRRSCLGKKSYLAPGERGKIEHVKNTRSSSKSHSLLLQGNQNKNLSLTTKDSPAHIAMKDIP